MKESESQIVSACLELLAYKNILAFRVNNTGIFDPSKKVFRSFHGMKGVSDILGILPKLYTGRSGVFFSCEVKREGGVISEAQRAFIQEVANHGGIAIVVHSVEELEDDLKEIMQDNLVNDY